MAKKALIIFGATGALAHDKIFPALKSLQADSLSFSDLEVIGYGRRDIDSSTLEGFTYLSGELSDFGGLSKFVKDKGISEIYCYISLPPNLYIQTIKLLEETFVGHKLKIALEKPFGSSLDEAIEMSQVVDKYGHDNFYLIDHYLAKQSVINFSNIPSSYKDTKDINEVEMSIIQDDNVENRGSFYDDLGAIKDVGQNHLLNTVAKFFSEDGGDFLQEIEYIKKSLIVGQYEEYLKTSGVKDNSKTETYFKAEFEYKGVMVTLRSGKGLDKTKTFLKVSYKNNKKLYIEISPKQIIIPNDFTWPEAKTTPHTYIIEDFLSDTRKFSISLNQAVDAWKVTSDLLVDKKSTHLKVYPKGIDSKKIE